MIVFSPSAITLHTPWPAPSALSAPLVLFTLFAMLPISVHADSEQVSDQDPPQGVIAVRDCRALAECPRIDQAYAATPPLRHALSESLRHGGEAVPEWLRNKLPDHRGEHLGDHQDATAAAANAASPMVPLSIDDAPYVLGRMHAPEQADHELVVLYDITRGLATVHYRNQDGERKLLGDTDTALTSIVNAYADRATPLARQLDDPGVALPVSLRRDTLNQTP